MHQAETINRLLKKQSRPRNKRNALATADDRTPATHTGAATPNDGDDEDGMDVAAQVYDEVIPTSYRWISTSRTSSATSDAAVLADAERKMAITFSVPIAVLPPTPSEGELAKMDVDDPPKRPRGTPTCDVEGCTSHRKYRLVKDWERGACGMDHLKFLERQAALGSVAG